MTIARVLVATDRTDRFVPTLQHLRDLDARVTLVAPGSAAVVAATELQHDLAVVDGDDRRSCRTVLLLSQVPSLARVVVMTEQPDAEDIGRCLVAGAGDILHWNGSPDRLAGEIVDRTRALPADRREAVALRRRDALRRLAAAEAQRPGPGVDVRVTALEPPPVRPAAGDVRSQLADLGPAQQRIVEGLLEGRTYLEIAEREGVSSSAVYQAKRRLARRVGVPEDGLAGWLRAHVAEAR